MKKILFLGSADSPVITWLKQQGEDIIHTEEKISPQYVLDNNFSFLISYGYKHILKKNVLDLFGKNAINMHISYLPYNRGLDPNFWSFIEESPKGVTIHYIDEGLDTGDIIVQKKVAFDDYNTETLASTYDKLQLEIQKLFFENWSSIKTHKCSSKPQTGSYTKHGLEERKIVMKAIKKDGWNTKISELLKLRKHILK